MIAQRPHGFSICHTSHAALCGVHSHRSSALGSAPALIDTGRDQLNRVLELGDSRVTISKRVVST